MSNVSQIRLPAAMPETGTLQPGAFLPYGEHDPRDMLIVGDFADGPIEHLYCVTNVQELVTIFGNPTPNHLGGYCAIDAFEYTSPIYVWNTRAPHIDALNTIVDRRVIYAHRQAVEETLNVMNLRRKAGVGEGEDQLTEHEVRDRLRRAHEFLHNAQNLQVADLDAVRGADYMCAHAMMNIDPDEGLRLMRKALESQRQTNLTQAGAIIKGLLTFF